MTRETRESGDGTVRESTESASRTLHQAICNTAPSHTTALSGNSTILTQYPGSLLYTAISSTIQTASVLRYGCPVFGGASLVHG
jgi:hypothetical protein